MEIKELVITIKESVNKPKYKYTDEFKELWTPKTFNSSEGKVYYKLDYQRCALVDINIIDDLINFLNTADNVYETVYKYHGVYLESHYKEGPYVNFEIDETDKYKTLIVYLNHKFVIIFNSYKLELAKNKNEIIERFVDEKTLGREAMIDINTRLNELIAKNYKISFTDLFTNEGKRKFDKYLKLCVLNQISWIDEFNSFKIVNHCQKADCSSAFPSQFTKLLPTLKRCVINKIYEPTKDYPFIFSYEAGKTYGRVQILNELDTEIDMKSKFAKQIKDQMLLSEKRRDNIQNESITIACKAANNEINDLVKTIFNELYNIKNTTNDEEEKMKAKNTMNAFIGYCQRNNNPILAFLSAVVIARQNHRMIEMCNQLEKEGNIVLYIATDCIIWQGFESNIATDNKYLGSFTYEAKNCKYFGVQVGAYQILENNNLLTKCSYLKKEDSKIVEFGKLPKPKNNKEFKICQK